MQRRGDLWVAKNGCAYRTTSDFVTAFLFEAGFNTAKEYYEVIRGKNENRARGTRDTKTA